MIVIPFSLAFTGSGAAAAILGRRRIVPLTALWPLTGLALIAAISAAFADDPILAFSRCAVFGSVLVLWWGITQHNSRIVSQVLLAAFIIIAGLALAESANSLIAGESLFSMTRPRSLFPNTNNLGAAMLPALALAWHRRNWRWFAVFAVVLLLTASRASMAGAAAGAVYLWLGNRRLSKKSIFAGIGGLLSSPLVLLRIMQSGQHGSLALRFDIWQAGIEAFKRNPLIGIGPENYQYAFQQFAQLQHEQNHLAAHNLFIQVAAELGTLGLIALAVVAAVAIWRVVQTYRIGDRRTAQIGAALLIAVIVHGLLDYVYGVPGNLLILLVSAWYLMEKRS